MRSQKNSSGPLVSVVMPMHNAAKYVAAAIASILRQSYRNIELIIIDDASTDEGPAIAASFNSPQVKMHRFSEKQGLARALNKGFEMASGDYIARMDADDESLPHRIARQVEYMERNPDISISGTQIIAIGNKSRKLPLSHDEITWHMLNACPFLHPSVIFRKSDVIRYGLFYDPDFYGAEDLELWMRASHVTRLANLGKAYVKYRYHFGMHQAMLDVVARLNTTIKITHMDFLLPGLNEALKNDLAVLMNRHLPHERNVDWYRKLLAAFDAVLTQFPGNRAALEREFNKCLWFHLSSRPALYPQVLPLLEQRKWVRLSFKQKVWLKVKRLISRQAGT